MGRSDGNQDDAVGNNHHLRVVDPIFIIVEDVFSMAARNRTELKHHRTQNSKNAL